MISKQFVYDTVLPLVKEKGRMIDYYLIMSLFENVDEELIDELKKYQNKDLGFGHGLEPDVQMPESSIVATNMAIVAIHQIKDQKKREPLIQDVVSYFEKSYDPVKDGFKLITEQVKHHPHAFWWTWEKYDEFFPYGNPDGEVIGFLFKHRKYLKTLDINKQVNNMVKFIMDDSFYNQGMHTLMSSLMFHMYMDQDVQNLIHDRLHVLVDKLIEEDKEKEDYGLEPYKIYIIDSHFTEDHTSLLNKNLSMLQKKVEALDVYPNWTWGQFEDLFASTIKYQWMGHIYFNIIKALRLHREL